MTGRDVVQATLQLTRALSAAGYDYVIGGALALAYWSVPRATVDVDMTIDVDLARLPDLINVLRAAGCEIDPARVLPAAERGDFGFRVNGLRVDAFLPISTHTEEALARKKKVPFGDSEVYIMSKEDVVLTKLMFGRSKDFADLERLLAEPSPTDWRYIDRWLAELFIADDSRVAWLNAIRTLLRE